MAGGKVRRHSRRFWRLTRRPVRDQWLVLSAFVLLGHSRYLIKKRGWSEIEPRLGRRMAETDPKISSGVHAEVDRVSWAIHAVRIYTPWVSNCFPQALTAHRLLARRGIECTVYFGAVLRAPEAALAAGASEVGAFAAHAWVRVGEVYVTGGDVRDLYEPMVWFAP